MTQQIKTLWQAHGSKLAFTVAEVLQSLPGETVSGPPMTVWWGKPALSRRKLHKLKVVQMTDVPGPVPKQGKKITIPHKAAPEVATLRIMCPLFYRKMARSSDVEDSPATVLAEVAQRTPCKVAEVTGGKWERLNHKHGSFLVAHVRVDKELADKAASKSGQGAIFTSVLPTKQNPLKPVAWIPKQSDMSREDYWKFAVSLGASQGKPLAIRQGGNADLGIVAGDTKEFPHKGPKVWVLRNSPRHWQSRHVHEFLSSELWTDVEIKTRRCNWRNGYNHEWLFKASEPPGASAAEPYFHYVDGDVHLTVVHETTFKQPKPREVEWLWGPKKMWSDKDFPQFQKDASKNEEVAPTLADENSQNDDNKDKQDGDGNKGHRERSPRRTSLGQNDVKPEDPDTILLKDLNKAGISPAWTIKDGGGNGDCGYRSAALSVAQSQNKTPSPSGIIREAAKGSDGWETSKTPQI